MTALFVTGAGTGVGKTLVARLLIRELRSRGRAVAALKPIVTGYDASSAEQSDTALLLAALGVTAQASAVDRVSPWRFRAALAPDMAAAREGRTVPFEALVEHCRKFDDSVTIIEGVGGVMVPLDAQHTVIDWIESLRTPTLLVTGSYLGAISHTLTAVTALSMRRIDLRGVIASESAEQPAPLAETVAAISRHVPDIPVVALPRLSELDAAPALLPQLSLADI